MGCCVVVLSLSGLQLNMTNFDLMAQGQENTAAEGDVHTLPLDAAQ